jgi:hypothetical protein
MDAAHLTGSAIFAGSVVGGLTSLTSAWLTKNHEASARRASENSVGRQKLYAQFTEEASMLYVDALVRDQGELRIQLGPVLLTVTSAPSASARRVQRDLHGGSASE